MVKQKVKKKYFTPSSQSPRQPPLKDKDVLGPSSPSSCQPPMPSSLPPSFALDSQPTINTNPSSISILGKAPVAPVGAHVSVGPSIRKHKSISATKFVEDIPPENLASEEDMEEEESSSCDFGSYSDDSSEPGEDDDSINLPHLQPTVLLPPLLLRLQSVVREEQAAKTAVRANGVALGPELLNSGAAATSVGRAELEFASFPSDPMCAEVAAAVGEWEII
ncbi:hypothetical protein DKX38_024324 [Salix brachista]|uniref:Uncharacterized protein n=1 Tax=Salix brachista TaxID=2182728 RepID=A0A5N5JS88_9ROSI|nr:hypothetical protein DKX38_024324 [Salix brachista]